MTDRLKLSDAKGDAEVERIASVLERREGNQRIKRLEQTIAALERELAKHKADAGDSAAQGGNKVGARKRGSFKAISTAPSVNLTPHGPTMVPVPYPVVQDLSSSVNTAHTVRFNGSPVYLLDASTQPHCTGDEAGTGKGIKSGTVSGEVKPVQGSSTVRIEGKQVVRVGDACTMNGGNCPGVYVMTSPPSSAPPKTAIETSNPPCNSSFKRGLSALEIWAVRVAQEMDDALNNPLRGTWGAAKELLINQPVDIIELLGRASMYEQAEKLGQTAAMLGALGQTKPAQVAVEAAQKTRGSAADLHIPKATLRGSAERGGADIANAVLITKAIVGLLKGGLKWVGSMHGTGEANEVGKISGSHTVPASSGDGVKILGGTEVDAFEKIYAKAPMAKEEIDALADEIAIEYGGTVAKAAIKSRERAMQKILNDYYGDASRIKDLARNTIIVPANKVGTVAAELKRRGAVVKIFDPAKQPLGYSGVNAVLKTKSGVPGEVQVNTPEMIFAKEPEKVARAQLGDEKYDEIARKVNVPGGQGHVYYEKWRVLDAKSPEAMEIADRSRKYHDVIRNSDATQ